MQIKTNGTIRLDAEDRSAYGTNLEVCALGEVSLEGELSPWERYADLDAGIRGLEGNRLKIWLMGLSAITVAFGGVNLFAAQYAEAARLRADQDRVAQIGGTVLVHEVERHFGIPS